MKYQAILFDVDGVLVETETKRFAFLKESSAKHGIHLFDADFALIWGKTTPTFFDELMSARGLNRQSVDSILAEYYAVMKPNYAHNVTQIPTAINFIKSYSGQTKIGVCTMNSREVTTELLEVLDLKQYVSGYITRSDVAHQKPHPEGYLKLAATLNIDPKECAVIEDSVVGIQSGIVAGMSGYVFLNSYNSKQQFEGLKISGFISSSADLSVLAL